MSEQDYIPAMDGSHPLIKAYRSYLGRLGGHGNKGSVAKSLSSKRTAQQRWRTRRAKFGPTGQRQPYQIRPELYPHMQESKNK